MFNIDLIAEFLGFEAIPDQLLSAVEVVLGFVSKHVGDLCPRGASFASCFREILGREGDDLREFYQVKTLCPYWCYAKRILVKKLRDEFRRGARTAGKVPSARTEESGRTEYGEILEALKNREEYRK